MISVHLAFQLIALFLIYSQKFVKSLYNGECVYICIYYCYSVYSYRQRLGASYPSV